MKFISHNGWKNDELSRIKPSHKRIAGVRVSWVINLGGGEVVSVWTGEARRGGESVRVNMELVGVKGDQEMG